jgi:hypothetical protein
VRFGFGALMAIVWKEEGGFSGAEIQWFEHEAGKGQGEERLSFGPPKALSRLFVNGSRTKAANSSHLLLTSLT